MESSELAFPVGSCKQYSAHVIQGVLYSLKSTKRKGKHLQKNLDTIMEIEVSHLHATPIGNGAKRWIEKYEEGLTDDETSFSSG